MSENTDLYLYNTETKEKHKIIPSTGGVVSLYTCGPTVYNFAHIGNFRTYICEDLLRRTLKFFGIDVKQVMNITDIDDKTIKGAINQGVCLSTYTAPYVEAFFQDLRSLGIEKAEIYPYATKYIGEMIKIIEVLLEKKVAYQGGDGSIYFNIRAFPSYGRLSHLELSALKAGASQRGSDEYDKSEAADFVLWKGYDPERDGKIFWDSPFGPGRPGWHIECSAMAMKILGETIDIHVGGVDNMFPHHENEIAQSEACSGKQFVKHWMHVEHLLVENKKMSKSLGNFFTLRDLLSRGYTGQAVRFMLLQGHYRMQLNFTFEGLDAATASLNRITDFLDRCKQFKGEKETGRVLPIVEKMVKQFKSALGDDLHIALALSAVFDAIRQINHLADQIEISMSEGKAVIESFQQIDKVLGILALQSEEEISLELQNALKAREKARAEKNYLLADQYRDFILAKGYKIEDAPGGVRLKKERSK